MWAGVISCGDVFPAMAASSRATARAVVAVRGKLAAQAWQSAAVLPRPGLFLR